MDPTPVSSVSTWAVGVAVVANGAKAYVTVNSFFTGDSGFSGSGGVVVVDTASNAVTRHIGLGALPGAIAVTPDGSRAYVAIDSIWVNTGYGAPFIPGRSVAVIDTLTDTAAGSIDLGAAGTNWTLQNTAKGLAVSPDRRYLYASIPRISAVSVADINANVVTTSIPVAPGPGGIGATAGSTSLVPHVITAANDSATVSAAGGDAVSNVLSNDRLGGLGATLAHVTLSDVSSDVPGLALDAARGAVILAPGTAIGVYALVYRICEKTSPVNCDDAVATVTVASVLTNDTLGGVRATVGTVILSRVSLTPATKKIRLDLTDGSVDVLGKTSSGLFALVYRICEGALTTNCSQATVSLDLSGR